MLLKLPLGKMLLLFPILILSLCVHEWAHAWVSTLQGDPTPRRAGRLTLNPLSHMDLWGTIMLLTVGFGWAKPVPIGIERYKRRYPGLVLTSLAGPLANFLIALVLIVGLRFLLVSGMLRTPVGSSLLTVIQYGTTINLLLFLFNLIPIPPLDGSRVVTALFHKNRDFIVPYNRYGFYVLLGLLVLNRAAEGRFLPLYPIMEILYNFLIRWIIPS